MRQQHEVAEHGQAAAVDLGVTGSLRCPVVKEHDPVGQCHRARRPGNHRRAQRRRDIEQVQSVRQDAHVAAGHDERGGLAEHAADFGAVRGDHRPAVRRPGLVELAADIADPAQVRRVELADGGDGLGQFLGQGLHIAAAALDGVDRPQRIIQPEQVDLLHLCQHPAQPPVGRGEILVTLLHVEPSPVQAEVDVTGAEQLAQLTVVSLAVAPPGGDRGDRAAGVQRSHHRVHRRPALRPQQRDLHDAWTWSVRPTVSSIACSVS